MPPTSTLEEHLSWPAGSHESDLGAYPYRAEYGSSLAVAATVNLRDSLRGSFDTAYDIYAANVRTINSEEAYKRGFKGSERLTLASRHSLLTEFDHILDNRVVLSELQRDIDHFSRYPEEGSPAASYRLGIIPEGLTQDDQNTLARSMQYRLNPNIALQIRNNRLNDRRIQPPSGLGYFLMFYPKHYNVPSGNTCAQTEWLRERNRLTTSVQFQTATDAIALSAIERLCSKTLGTNESLKDATYFKRFDQTPIDLFVSSTYVDEEGGLHLCAADVNQIHPARVIARAISSKT